MCLFPVAQTLFREVEGEHDKLLMLILSLFFFFSGQYYLSTATHPLACFDRAIMLIRRWLTALCLRWLVLGKRSIIQLCKWAVVASL